jgi:hypothetical protein
MSDDVPALVGELLPCPMCGGPAHEDELDHGEWLVGCEACNSRPECSIYVTGKGRSDAITAWNHRPALTPTPEADDLARLEGLLAKGCPESDSGWFVEGHTNSGLSVIGDGLHSGIFPIKCEGPQAALIVAAINALPGLIAALRTSAARENALREERDAILRAIDCPKHLQRDKLALHIAHIYEDLCAFHDRAAKGLASRPQLLAVAAEARALTAERERDEARAALEQICASRFGLQGIQEDHGHDTNAYNYHAMRYWRGVVANLETIARTALQGAPDHG